MFLICMLIASFGPPVFLLAVRHFQLETETEEWMVSLWPHSLSSVALEDRRALADMAVSYGELAAVDTLIYSAIVWGGIFLFRRIFGRAGKKRDSGTVDSGLGAG